MTNQQTKRKEQIMKHVKTLLCCSLGVLALFLSACAPARENVVLAPVGPSPIEPARSTSQGELVVYSKLESPMSSSDEEAILHHADYKIYLAEGTLVKSVRNQVGYLSKDPAPVSLPPGRYTVVADAARPGIVTVPVVIEAGKTTAVHLDGSEPDQGKSAGGSDLVHLPDGTIVGWGARDENERK
jgi:hypothetical protein